MHIECPKDVKFVMPLSWVTKPTTRDSTITEVISSRCENVAIIGQSSYMVSCGAIKGQVPEGQKGHIKHCYKADLASHKERLATRPEPVMTAPFVKIARKECLVTIKRAICPLIVNCMIEGQSQSGALTMHTAIPTERKAWSSYMGHKRTRPGVRAGRGLQEALYTDSMRCDQTWEV